MPLSIVLSAATLSLPGCKSDAGGAGETCGDTTSGTTAPPTEETTGGTTVTTAETSSTGSFETGSASSGGPVDPTTSSTAESSSDGDSGAELGPMEDDGTGATSEDGGSDGDPFPAAPAFGMNVLDYDLVGSWGLNWQAEDGFDSVLEIDDLGEFLWRETSADCSTSTLATGHLWVEGMQVVMHVETWERPLPWDTAGVIGESFPPPFRLRMSFSLQGGGGEAYLALAAPPRVTEAAAYAGASYVRIFQQGAYLGGTWHGEAELQAVPDGQTEAVTIVRDVYEALLDPESEVANAESTGTRAATSTYFYPEPQALYSYAGGNWTCLDGCPSGSGITLVDGGNLFTYGPYASYQHLMTFANGRTFRRDVGSDCP